MAQAVLSDAQRAIVDALVADIAPIPGVRAVVLGGSRARGRARPDSDIDLGVYYDGAAPFDIAAMRAVAAAHNDAPDPVVASFGEWGAWVDGGAWLIVEGERVDLLWRDLRKVEHVLAEARAGRYEIDYLQQPAFGFFGPTLLGEAAIAQPLHDPDGIVLSLRRRLSSYPPALREAVVQNALWSVQFGLTAFAPKFVANGDVYGVGGCLTRFAHQLVLALFALNETWFLNEKTALAEIAEFSLAPSAFGSRLVALLGRIGESREDLASSVAAMERLFRETAVLAGDAYRPAWRF
jgi:hypothetical protein